LRILYLGESVKEIEPQWAWYVTQKVTLTANAAVFCRVAFRLLPFARYGVAKVPVPLVTIPVLLNAVTFQSYTVEAVRAGDTM